MWWFDFSDKNIFLHDNVYVRLLAQHADGPLYWISFPKKKNETMSSYLDYIIVFVNFKNIAYLVHHIIRIVSI
jgi:hypothetical protein